MSKYKAISSNGFDSKMEEEFHNMLIGLGVEFESQKRFLLQPSYELEGKKIKEINYVCDFYLTKLDIVIDVKGFATTDFKLKQKIFGKVYGKKINCITKCPGKYNRLNKDCYFKGWIDTNLLKKLRKESKKNKII